MADKARGRNNWIGGRKQRIQADATVVASDAMRAAINQLNAALSTASLPFDAVDEHEY